MYCKALFLIPFLAGLVPSVFACEGECIVAITKAFLGNYSTPIHAVFKELSEQISELLPPTQRPSDPAILVQPILLAYANDSYESLKTAIFPSYFHGKCQRFSKDDQDPPGCPKPDCPVICGTPGSLVHFYPTLRYIAFNSTKITLERLTTPGNSAYHKVEEITKAHMHGQGKRDLTATHGMGTAIDPRVAHGRGKQALSRHFGSIGGKRSEAGAQKQPSASLAEILSQFDKLFVKACGGDPRDSKDALPKCSWESEMKKYILSFP